jgi:hypothetical protein
MASKAARQEPTSRGYHTGTHVAARESCVTRCVLSRKTRHGDSRDSDFRQEGGASSGRGGNSRSLFEESWPVVNEQSENGAREEKPKKDCPTVVLREVCR